MDWRLKQITPPTATPVTVDEVRTHSRIDVTSENTLIERLIEAATKTIDGPYGIGVCLKEQTWEMAMDYFPLVIQIPLYPVLSVESITYIDEAGAEQTLSESVYRVDTHDNPASISLAWNQVWPSARLIRNSVKVQFKAGYTSVPQDLRQAIIMLVAHWYENREAVNVGNITTVMPMAVESILARYRVPGVA